MKTINTLTIITAVTLIITTLLPNSYARNGRHGFKLKSGIHAGGNAERRFDRLDVDGDELINEDEYLDSRQLERKIDCKDDDDDGLISREEAEHPNRFDIDREALLECIRETLPDFPDADERFDSTDTNGDGFINLAELEEKALERFAEIDTSEDGSISLEELEAAIEEKANVRSVRRACIDEISDAL